MYYDYYGFNQPPFRITPDTSLFYPGGDRGAILDALLYAIRNGEGIVKVVGEVGSGKTMLCRMLEKELPENVEVVYLVNPSIAPENTLHAIAFELKLGVNQDTSRFEVMNQLQQHLLKRHSENRQVVVFVEEAQSMPIATLEEIRLLSNLETRQSKLLQIVLFGQPELDDNISRPEIRQLKERITYSFELTPFKTDDIRQYLNARVRACGFRAAELFETAAIRLIERRSKGLLRRINILADKSLLAAYSDNSRKVRAKHARMAVRDSEFMPRPTRGSRPVVLALLLGIAATVATGLFAYRMMSPDRTGTGSAVTSGAIEAAVPAAGAPVAPDSSQAARAGGEPAATGTLPAVKAPAAAPQNGPEPDVLPPETASPAPVQAGTVQEDGNPTAVSPMSGPDNRSAQPATSAAEASTALSAEEAGAGRGDFNPEGESVVEGLSDLPTVYRLQDYGGTRGTGESAQLQRQLQQMPPEAAEAASAAGDYYCERCWTIVYRPVRSGENL